MSEVKSDWRCAVLAISVLGSMSGTVHAIDLKVGESDFGTLTGYVRAHAGVITRDQPERDVLGRQLGDAGDINMMRGTIFLQYDTRIADIAKATLIYRGSREYETNYLEGLDDQPFQSGDLMHLYNESDLREWYLDFSAATIDWRIGRQQVVWGETDSFQALDIVHGFDFTWRSTLEAENEELRIPLIIINGTKTFDSLNGALQVIVRPGLDDDEDVGHLIPFEGGRWGQNGSRAFNVLNNPVFPVPFNYDHRSGDTDDPSYGAKWSGTIGNVGYSLNYYHTLNLEPVINSSIAPHKEAPSGSFAEFILPEIDIVGGSFNWYSAPLDLVFRGEAAITLDKPYNIGYVGSDLYNMAGGAIPGGFFGVKEKDTARVMFGIDKTNLNLTQLLKTSQPSFLTFQVFDTWIPGFKDSDQLTNGTSKRHEHEVTASVALGLNYKYDTIQPSLAAIWDVTSGGGALVESINFVFGDHWRLKFTAVQFLLSQQTCDLDPRCTHAFGGFYTGDQIDARLTYQF